MGAGGEAADILERDVSILGGAATMPLSGERHEPAAALRGRRVVFVLAGEVLGGAERASLELARDLSANAASVHICALDNRDGPARSVATQYGIPWSCTKTPWVNGRLQNALALVRVAMGLRRLRPDILISATNLPNVVCGLTWRATGASVSVWNQHDVFGTTRINQRLFRRALQASPLVVTGADHARRWLIECLGARPHRVHVVRDKVELPPARDTGATWRERLGLSGDDIVGCMLAHLHSGKDHVTLLRAWRLVVDRLVPEGRRPVLLLAGRDAGAGDAAKALAFDLDLHDYVRFVGEVDDVSGFLGAPDLAVFSSRSELLGRGATEPMAAGLPVVGTDVPGIREALGEGGVPFLAPPGDAPGLAEVILRFATDPELRARVGRANSELIRARQSGLATSDVYMALLAETLATPGLVR
jgi:glycosyltransferase involved in cell wall biosynthesis